MISSNIQQNTLEVFIKSVKKAVESHAHKLAGELIVLLVI